jgi:hypothetical protein
MRRETGPTVRGSVGIWGTPLFETETAWWTRRRFIFAVAVIHNAQNVFENPADGGRPPFENIYLPAIESGLFVEVSATGSLRVLQKT